MTFVGGHEMGPTRRVTLRRRGARRWGRGWRRGRSKFTGAGARSAHAGRAGSVTDQWPNRSRLGGVGRKRSAGGCSRSRTDVAQNVIVVDVMVSRYPEQVRIGRRGKSRSPGLRLAHWVGAEARHVVVDHFVLVQRVQLERMAFHSHSRIHGLDRRNQRHTVAAAIGRAIHTHVGAEWQQWHLVALRLRHRLRVWQHRLRMVRRRLRMVQRRQRWHRRSLRPLWRNDGRSGRLGAAEHSQRMAEVDVDHHRVEYGRWCITRRSVDRMEERVDQRQLHRHGNVERALGV